MMCWNQTNSVLDSPAVDSANTMKLLENTENSSNTAKAICTGLSNDENGGIPSLQGVKVPDENLTPQQRQHREEQLAKLKKMNQFLFPENGGNDFHPQGPSNNPIMAGKMQMPSETLTASMPVNPVTLMNMTGPNMGSKLNAAAAAMRNIAGSLMNHTKGGASNTQLDNIPNLGEDIIMPADMMGGGPNEMAVIPPNIKQGCMPNINNPGGLAAATGGRGLINTGGSNLNMINNSGSISTMPPGNLMHDPNNAMMGNSSDVLSTFNANHCPGPNQEGNGGVMMGSHKNINAPPNHPSDINPAVGMSQMEWSKLHHHIYEERLKNNHPNSNIPPELNGGPIGCQQTLTRCNSTGIGSVVGMSTHRSNPNANPNNRGNQGPPPPYHPTQRSASVPIATQSPNPSSPNNPTSNMSLPSPRASNTMGGSMSSTTSPSMDVTSASSASTANTNSTTTTTTASNTTSGNSSSNKNAFSQQGSPTSCSASGNSNRNRSNVNSLNSNPTTPLSHVSPKDIDSKNVNTTPTPGNYKAMIS